MFHMFFSADSQISCASTEALADTLYFLVDDADSLFADHFASLLLVSEGVGDVVPVQSSCC
jgi:hypothetical protein